VTPTEQFFALLPDLFEAYEAALSYRDSEWGTDAASKQDHADLATARDLLRRIEEAP